MCFVGSVSYRCSQIEVQYKCNCLEIIVLFKTELLKFDYYDPRLALNDSIQLLSQV